MTTPHSLLKEQHRSFVDRMNVLEELVGNKRKLALRAGISNSGIRHYFEQGEPTRPQLIALAKAAGVHLTWLVTGEGPIRPVAAEAKSFIVEAFLRWRGLDKPDTAPIRLEFVKAYNNQVFAHTPGINNLSLYELNLWLTEFAAPTPNGADYVTASFYDLDDPTGDPSESGLAASARKDAPLCFRRDLAVDKWKLDAQEARLVAVSSDDLQGPFRPHDWVLCDCRRPDVPRSGIYLIRTPDGLVFRRVQFPENGVIRVIAEARPSAGGGATGGTVEEYRADEVEVLGRAFGYWRRVRT